MEFFYSKAVCLSTAALRKTHFLKKTRLFTKATCVSMAALRKACFFPKKVPVYESSVSYRGCFTKDALLKKDAFVYERCASKKRRVCLRKQRVAAGLLYERHVSFQRKCLFTKAPYLIISAALRKTPCFHQSSLAAMGMSTK